MWMQTEGCARGLAGDGDVAWVATERGDVASDPAQGFALILKTVGAVGLRGEVGMSHEAEDAQPVVE